MMHGREVVVTSHEPVSLLGLELSLDLSLARSGQSKSKSKSKSTRFMGIMQF
jgi:hypothetical protein